MISFYYTHDLFKGFNAQIIDTIISFRNFYIQLNTYMNKIEEINYLIKVKDNHKMIFGEFCALNLVKTSSTKLISLFKVPSLEEQLDI